MAWVARTATTATSAVAAVTLNKPSGVAQHDVMVAVFITATVSAITDPNTPTGWTRLSPSTGGFASVAGDATMHIFWKLATASEPASYTWTFSAAENSAAIMGAWAGGDANTVVEGTSGAAPAAGLSHLSASITPTTNGALIVSAIGRDGSPTDGTAQYTVPSPWTELTEVVEAGTGSTASMAWRELATAGSTSVTWSSTISDENAVWIVAFKPAAGGGGTTHQLEAVLSGAGASTVGANLQAALAATESGVGTVTGAANLQAALAAVESGEGSLAAQLAIQRAIEAALSGAGSVAADPDLKAALNALLSGTGAVGGNLTGPGAALHQLAAALSGAGGATGGAAAQRALAAVESGVGSVTGTAALRAALVAALSGAGTVQGSARMTAGLAGLLSGSGAVSADLSGVGALHQLVALLSGAGGLLASASIKPPYPWEWLGVRTVPSVDKPRPWRELLD